MNFLNTASVLKMFLLKFATEVSVYWTKKISQVEEKKKENLSLGYPTMYDTNGPVQF